MKIYHDAVRYLARREHSVKELRDKLSAKGHALAEIDETLTRLQSENLQSDERFVEMLVRSRISQGKGPHRISHELQEHGFVDAQIKPALDQAEVSWNALAAQVRAQRFGHDLPGEFEEKAKQMRFLQYRGFDSTQIKHAMKPVSS